MCSFAGNLDVCDFCLTGLGHIDRRFMQIPVKVYRRISDRRVYNIPAKVEMREVYSLKTICTYPHH